MPEMSIRGSQIKDAQIEDRHINGQLTEAVLDIDFQSHADEILDMKMVVDNVQQNDINVAANSYDFTFKVPVTPTSDPAIKGIVVGQYQVSIRDASTGEPLMYEDIAGGISEPRAVYGVINSGIDANDVDGNYLYTVDVKVVKDDGTATTAMIAEATTIDITYPRRFSLADVDETFASNEKFVDGAADVTAHLNIRQLASEVFGEAYVLNNLGDLEDPFGNGNSFLEELSRVTHGTINTLEDASSIIDEIVAARSGSDSLLLRLTDIVQKIDDDTQEIRTDLATSASGKGAEMVRALDSSDSVSGLGLTEGNRTVQHVLDGLYNKIVDDLAAHVVATASNDVGLGASLVGISDADNNFTATDVEGAIAELYTKIVDDVAAEAEARSTADSALSTRATNIETELTAARGDAATLDDRLDVTLNNDGTMKEFTRLHKHHYYTKDIGADAVTDVVFTFSGGNQFDIPKSTDSYKVYVNGVLQKNISSVYSISVSMNDVTVSFVEGLYNQDVIGLDASINGDTQL